ncbi:MAG: NlpC/P60 family protein [Clostridiales bacterium]|nr:NlpC/P60 family protein [Clostridiales bacterium]
MRDDLQLGTRDKVVQRNTRDGLVEDNLSKGSSERISSRAAEETQGAVPEEKDYFGKDRSLSDGGKRKRGNRSIQENTEFTDDGAQERNSRADMDAASDSEPRRDNAFHSDKESHGGEKAASDESSSSGAKSQKRSRLEEKSARANAWLEKEQEKQYTRKRKIKKQRIYDEEKGKAKTRLRFDDELVPVSDGKGAAAKAGSLGKAAGGKAAAAVTGKVHSKIYQAEDENLGVKSAHRTELAAEGAGRMARSTVGRHNSKLAQQKKVQKLEHRAEQANTRLLFEKSVEENPEIKKSKVRKWQQKREIKRRYAAAYKATRNGAEAVSMTSTAAAPVTAFSKGTEKAKTVVSSFARKHYAGIAAACFAGLVLIMFIGSLGTLGSMISETGGAVVESTYLSSDDDILAADAAYTEMEEALQAQVDGIESDYPGYDEYRYQVDEITHDSYALISYLTARYGNFTIEDVESELSTLFSEQFSMSVWDEVEIRTRTVTHSSTDPDTGETTTWEEEEEYEWYVLNIQVTNQGLDAIAQSNLNENQLSLYQIYQASLGNRSDLFGETITAGNVAGGGISYEIPAEALSDEKFAAMITEAEKYLGMAYVWGGYSPTSGFDCSGFVSYVINHCGVGWDYGRLTANGLMGICTYVSESKAQPGDLIFFEKTYNTSGASHVGIYVGNGMMIHCGNPIQYTSIETSYWQQHFLCFGRLP